MIAAAVSFGSSRLLKSTFRPDFDSNGMQIIWDREFGFLKETLVAPVPRVVIMLGRTFGGATAATLQGCIVLFLALFFVFTRIVGC
jgi:ABC-type multidrug transport system permease subunit